jgi:ATP-binding cassette, subfamily B, bacterial PglK
MNQALSKFLYVTKGRHKALILMMLLFLLTSSLEMVGTGLVGPFIAAATNPDSIRQAHWLNWIYQTLNLKSNEQFLLVMGSVVISIFYIKSFLSFSAQKRIFEFGFHQQGELSSRLMRAYLAAPYTFHLGRNSAGLIQNIINETERFSNGLMMPLLTSISNAIVILALVILLLKTNAIASLTIAGVLLISFFLFSRFKDRITQWGKIGSDSRTEMIRLINHSLGGLKETRVLGCESYFQQQMEHETHRYAVSASLALSFSNLPRYIIEAFLITFLIGFTFLFITVNQGNTQDLSSVLGIFALASIRLLPATGNLMSAINGIRYNAYSLDQLYFDLKELEVAQHSDSNGLEARSLATQRRTTETLSFNRTVTLDAVLYQYPDAARNALHKVSFSINKGESIALIGKSGAGKTTLVDIILGLLIPQHGDICIDGVSIYNDLKTWRSMIGYVPQSIFLIDDTLERNIAFGVPDHLIDSYQIEKAIRAAQLSELIEQLPKGINTIVGERGVLLSGGQRQRVGIARALYHEREILVFDEATAALDSETESLVTEAISALSGIKTMIIIAHRLSTIEHCDRVYVLQNGQVIKSGTYQDVVQLG